jgi:hypothetical protein
LLNDQSGLVLGDNTVFSWAKLFKYLFIQHTLWALEGEPKMEEKIDRFNF